MMNEQNIKEQYESIIKLLKEQRLKEAHTQLNAMLTACSDLDLHNRLEQVRTSYQYMLQYMQQGINDPERDKLHKNLLAETWEIVSQARINMLDNVSSSYYQTLHTANRQNGNVSLSHSLQILETFEEDMAICNLLPGNQQQMEQIINRQEETNRQLFLSTWGNSCWTHEEVTEAYAFLTSQRLRPIDLSLFVSAVSLSLTECFDIRKCLWLIDTYQTTNAQVNQRALVGLILTLYIHAEQTALYTELAVRISLLGSNPIFHKDLKQIYLQLLQSKETQKINKKMREEIFPEMIKNVKNIMPGLKFGFDESIEENDQNPDWEKTLNDTEFNEKIRQINELQMEGADLQFCTFISMKSAPFFNNPSNWFYPFDFKHPATIKVLGFNFKDGNYAGADTLLNSGVFCDSDKYSLCLTLTLLPPQQRTMMLEQLNQQIVNGLSEGEDTQSILQYAAQRDVNSRLYIQDIYRFYKCFRLKHELRDIFKEELALYKLPLLKDILEQVDTLTEVADFLIRKEHYTDALEIYHILSNKHQGNADIFQKTGFCLQKEKRYTEAIEAYNKADILKPDYIWTLRHLATCYRQQRNYTQALEYYHKVEEMQPENSNILFLIGSCLAELKRYDEALKYFFKLDFMENNNIKAWRAIAWCSLVCGKTEQADRYYNKILLSKHTIASDYLNAGHTAWVEGHMKEAIIHYQMALSATHKIDNFLDMFYKDKETLINLGIQEKDIPLMLDLVL